MARGMAQGSGTAQRRVSAKAIIVAVVVVLVLWWAFANRQSVRVHWIISDTTSPLVIVIVAAAAVGFGAGYLSAHMRNRRS